METQLLYNTSYVAVESTSSNWSWLLPLQVTYSSITERLMPTASILKTAADVIRHDNNIKARILGGQWNLLADASFINHDGESTRCVLHQDLSIIIIKAKKRQYYVSNRPCLTSLYTFPSRRNSFFFFFFWVRRGPTLYLQVITEKGFFISTCMTEPLMKLLYFHHLLSYCILKLYNFGSVVLCDRVNWLRGRSIVITWKETRENKGIKEWKLQYVRSIITSSNPNLAYRFLSPRY